MTADEHAQGRIVSRLRTPARWPARWRWIVLILVLDLVALVAAGVWGYTKLRPRPVLVGTVFTPSFAAYDFRLIGPEGRTVSLGSFRGKAVALTFLYTHCPDVCPLIADKMHAAYRRLGGVANRVALVAVSVDPRGDTPASVRAFLKLHRVEHELVYLRGSFAELWPVWHHYYIGTDAKMVTPEAALVSPPSPDLVTHTAAIYIIDPQGMARALLSGGDLDPADLATDLRLLGSGRVR